MNEFIVLTVVIKFPVGALIDDEAVNTLVEAEQANWSSLGGLSDFGLEGPVWESVTVRGEQHG